MHLMEPTCQWTQAPLILNLCTTWRWMASLTLRPYYRCGM